MTGLPLNINVQQIFLHMMNFIILAGGLYFLLYKPVKAFMDKRIVYFADLEKSAKDKNAEAENIEHQYEEKLRAAEEEGNAIKAKAAHDAEEIIKKSKLEAEEESHKIIDDAHERALKEKDKIVHDAEHDIIELVLAAEKKILHEAEEHNVK